MGLQTANYELENIWRHGFMLPCLWGCVKPNGGKEHLEFADEQVLKVFYRQIEHKRHDITMNRNK